MGRIIFGLMAYHLMVTTSFAITVHDPISFAKTAETAATSMKTLNGVTEMSGKLGEALNTANKSLGELSALNSVLGGPLSNSVLGKLSSIRSTSRRYGGLLSALNGTLSGHSSGYALNSAAHSTLGTPNVSKFITAKNHIERKYYQVTGKKYEYKRAKAVRIARDKAARKSVVTTLAVSKAHKEDLKDDHEDLVSISREAGHSGDMNHQILIQTKLLERIAQNQEKLILLQSQQLDFMAKTYLGDQAVDPRDLRLNEEGAN